MSVPWHQNDTLFRTQVNAGRGWEAYVAYKLIAAGFEVHVPSFFIRPTVAQRKAYRDIRDMVVEGKEIEIKSSSRFFTCPDDHPDENIMVDTCEKVDSKGEPFSFLIVSQKTGEIIAIPGKTRNLWKVKKGFDRVRKIEEQWYVCPASVTRTFDEFLQALEKIKNNKLEDK
jgi:hypothetical protein